MACILMYRILCRYFAIHVIYIFADGEIAPQFETICPLESVVPSIVPGAVMNEGAAVLISG